jgi:MFS family permease
MLVVFFIGMGLAAVAAALVSEPWSMLVALCGIGLFAAIYHPIGIPLVLKNSSDNQGKALAINGVFGSLGAALAALISGYLLSIGGRPLAFMLPGVIAVLTGVCMLLAMLFKLISIENKTTSGSTQTRDIDNWIRPFLLLLFCMTFAGLIYHATQTSLPKVFSIRLAGNLANDVRSVGFYVAVVYTFAGLFQFVGGMLADRYPLKRVYLVLYLLQVPLLVFAATLAGISLVLVVGLVVSLGIGSLPAENMLLARYTPDRHHGLAFGAKFVLSFGVAPLAVLMVAGISAATGEFAWVFLSLALAALLVFAVVIWLPEQKDSG